MNFNNLYIILLLHFFYSVATRIYFRWTEVAGSIPGRNNSGIDFYQIGL